MGRDVESTMPPRVPEEALPPIPKWVQRVQDDVKYDTTSARKEYLFKMPGPLHKLLEPDLVDKRDSIMLDLLFNITVMVLPSAVFQFVLPATLQPYRILFGLLHVALILGVFTQRFILCLHYSEHKRMFKPGSPFTALHAYAPYILCPVFGIPSGCYRLHHVVMHHLEDNVFPEDLSSTMPYQRDNFFHFLHYWLRFVLAIHVELPYYAWKAGRTEMMVQCVAALWTWMLSIYVLYGINPTATTFTLIVPFFAASLAMMFGNWSQHIFVDPKRPTVDYALTYNCINHVENLTTFNDGYHIVHHINSRIHWSEMPQRFLDALPKYASEDAITFSGIHFMEVGVFVMTGQWSKLAKAFVHLTDTPRSDEEIIAMLKSRLKPCHVDDTNKKVK